MEGQCVNHYIMEPTVLTIMFTWNLFCASLLLYFIDIQKRQNSILTVFSNLIVKESLRKTFEKANCDTFTAHRKDSSQIMSGYCEFNISMAK